MMTRLILLRRLAGCLLAGSCSIASAEIAFEEVTAKAGVQHRGPTYGAAWGDVNGDGWPDIWIGNHLIDSNKPVLYLNQRNGRFRDITDEAVSVDPRADLHGAAWGDYDNDGDQDLVVTAGGGGGIDEPESNNDNHLFVNVNGKLIDESARLGLLDPQGRGRSALWLDADRDGLLDVLFTNFPRRDGKAPPAIYHQTATGFVSANDLFGFKHTGLSRSEKLHDLLDNVLHLRPRYRRARINASDFAQLAQLDGQGSAELLAYLGPLRIFSMDKVPLTDVTNRFTMPDVKDVQDVAVEDFNGDGRVDLFLARAVPSSSAIEGGDLVQPSATQLKGRMVKEGQSPKPVATRFRSMGGIKIGVYPPWVNPQLPEAKKPKFVIGSERQVVSQPLAIRLSPDEPRLAGGRALSDMGENELTVLHDAATSTWTVASTIQRVNFTVDADQPIEQVEPLGFTPSKGLRANALLLQQDGLTFKEAPPMQPTACHSVAAGDFDNDMDVDLYLVCTGPVENMPNILLENQGAARFVPVPCAGGAGGDLAGRGDVAVIADYDRDGALDLFLTNGRDDLPPFSHEGIYQLFHNKGNGNHWLEIDLQGGASNRDGIGAVVEVQAGGIRQFRTQGGGMHHHAQDDKRLHFGLKDHAKVESIKVNWPSGAVQTLHEVPADQILRIVETPDAGATPETKEESKDSKERGDAGVR